MPEIFERRNVWTLHRKEPWHPTIAWYARAVGVLNEITDTADPRSLLHLANIHGTTTPSDEWPSEIAPGAWNACQHGGWFFLPWHRIYLHHFEKIVRATIAELGGPADWALPYWNYDPADPETLALPPEFRDAAVLEGGANPLFTTERDDAVVMDPTRVETSAAVGVPWTRRFTSDFASQATFGGLRTNPQFSGMGLGQLEREPHGPVHVDVGGGGWMGSFQTAARDPIFWLHHANIDRLWEWWRRQVDDQPLPLDEPRWMDQEFTFGRADVTTTLKVRDIVTTTDAPLCYSYDGLPVAGPPVPAPEALPAPRSRAPEMAEIPPELVGASGPVPLATGRAVRIDTGEPERALRPESLAAPVEVSLVLENVTGTDVRPRYYSVHVNLPDDGEPGEYPDRRVGGFSSFGITEASRDDEEHSGSGLTYAFDITPIVARLAEAGEWDPAGVQVTVTPDAGDTGDAGDVRIGRIGVYYG